MKITILSNNIKLTSKLKDFVDKKISVLDHVSDDIMEAWVELDEDKSQMSGEKKYRAEAQIKLRGGSLRAEKTSGDIYVAINQIVPKLKKEIERFKTKFRLPKRGKRIF